jgi:ABC-type Zn uptake system ZnuABC Zn-binding protein ZnuA
MKAPPLISLFGAAALLLAACAGAAPAAPTLILPTATTAPPVVPTVAMAPPLVATASAQPKPTEAPKPTANPLIPTVAPPKASRPLALVASMPIVKDLLDNLVAGIQGVTVAAIVPLGSDPHEYEPTPSDAKAIAGASAIIVVGAQYEDEWLVKLLSGAGGGKTAKVVAAEGITLKAIDKAFNAEFDNDPHIWMDPARWQQAVRNVAKGLAALDPAIAPAVNANADAYVARLKDLDAFVKAETGRIPEAQRVLVTTHDAMGYYAERYGLRVVGAVIAGGSTAAAPSAQSVKRLVDLIKANKVKAVFSEAGLNPKLTEAVAKEAGVAFVDALYVDTLSDPKGPAATYIDMIRYNTATIVGALR